MLDAGSLFNYFNNTKINIVISVRSPIRTDHSYSSVSNMWYMVKGYDKKMKKLTARYIFSACTPGWSVSDSNYVDITPKSFCLPLFQT